MTDRANREAEQLRDLLSSHGVQPMAPTPEPPMAVLDDDLEAIYARVTQRGRTRRGRFAERLGHWFEHHHALALSGMAAVVVLIVGGFIAQALLRPPTPAAADTPPMLDYEYDLTNDPNREIGVPGAAPLRKMADLAEKQPYAVPSDPALVQYVETFGWYSASEVGDDSKVINQAIYPTHYQFWTGRDGTQYAAEEYSDFILDPNGQVFTGENPFPAMTPGIQYMRYRPDPIFPADVASSLPRDPAELRKKLLGPGFELQPGEHESLYLVQEIWNYQLWRYISPDVEAAFWRMLAEDPGVRSLGVVTDRGGTSGEAFAFWTRDDRSSLNVVILDAKTGYLAGVEEIAFTQEAADSNIKVKLPAVTSFTNWLEQGWRKVPPQLINAPYDE